MDSVSYSVVDETARGTTVRLSDVVEVGDVWFLGESHDPDFSSTLLNPGKGKKGRGLDSLVVKRKQFSRISQSAPQSLCQENPASGAAFDRNFDKSGSEKNGSDCHAAPIVFKWA